MEVNKKNRNNKQENKKNGNNKQFVGIKYKAIENFAWERTACRDFLCC